MGDVLGHPFHGNQWTGAKGGSRGETTVRREDWSKREQNNTAHRLASDLRDRAVEMEPGVTKILQDATEATGGHLEGLQYRLKEIDSLRRKLLTRKALTPEGANEEINDALRYTVVSDLSNYTKQYNSVLESLAKQGYTPKRALNYWSDSPSLYQGVNLVMEGIKGKFELQFHTRESYVAKEKTHRHYEVYRTTKEPSVKIREFKAMQEIQSKVRRPEGWPPRNNRFRLQTVEPETATS